MTKRRKFSPEFKREAVKLTLQPGISCSQIALEIGVAPNLLSRWKREAEAISDKAAVAIHGMKKSRVLNVNSHESPRSAIFCGKRQRTSPRARPEISGYSTLSRVLSYTPNVPMPEGISQWLLRLGIAYAKQAADRECPYRCPDEGNSYRQWLRNRCSPHA